jgi:hypothetical protein
VRWRQEQSWTESKREGLSKMRMSDPSKENSRRIQTFDKNCEKWVVGRGGVGAFPLRK